jgi:hypothetical protein
MWCGELSWQAPDQTCKAHSATKFRLHLSIINAGPPPQDRPLEGCAVCVCVCAHGERGPSGKHSNSV